MNIMNVLDTLKLDRMRCVGPLLLVLGVGACAADRTAADTDGGSSTGAPTGTSEMSSDDATPPVTTEPLTTGAEAGGLPFDCIACSLLLQFIGGGGMPMDGGMMPPADGGMPEIEFCDGAIELLDGLIACGCDVGCTEACADYCAAGFDPTTADMGIIDCLTCVAGDDACSGPVQACETDELPSESTGSAEDGSSSSSGPDATSSSGTSTDTSGSGSTGVRAGW